MFKVTKKLLKRFWDKIDKTSNLQGCWEWTASLRGGGYGGFGVEGRIYRAHRVSYFLHTKVNPKDLHVLHTCDNPKCVNPRHLFLGTHRDNMKDMSTKTRAVRGRDHYNVKLQETEVLDIRKKYKEEGKTYQELAKEYGVAHSQVGFIVTKTSWKHI